MSIITNIETTIDMMTIIMVNTTPPELPSGLVIQVLHQRLHEAKQGTGPPLWCILYEYFRELSPSALLGTITFGRRHLAEISIDSTQPPLLQMG